MSQIFKYTRYKNLIKSGGGGEDTAIQNMSDIAERTKLENKKKVDEGIIDLLNYYKDKLVELNKFYYKNIEGENIIKEKTIDDDIFTIENKDKEFNKLRSSRESPISFYVTKSSVKIEEFKSIIKKYKTKTKDKFVIITDDVKQYKELQDFKNIIVLDISNTTPALAAYDIVDNLQNPTDAETFNYIFLYGVLDKKGIYNDYKGEIALVLSRLISVILNGHTKSGGLSPELDISAISLMWKNLGLNTQTDLPAPINFYGKTSEKRYSAFTDQLYTDVMKVKGKNNIVENMKLELEDQLKTKPKRTNPPLGNQPPSGSQPNDADIDNFLTAISGADTEDELIKVYQPGGLRVIITNEPRKNYNNVGYILTAKGANNFFRDFKYDDEALGDGKVKNALTEYIEFVKKTHQNGYYYIPYNTKALDKGVLKKV